jgi:hypothetical protein
VPFSLASKRKYLALQGEIMKLKRNAEDSIAHAMRPYAGLTDPRIAPEFTSVKAYYACHHKTACRCCVCSHTDRLWFFP